ncbi:MAG: PAS domain S-box protein, partial [bacterium]
MTERKNRHGIKQEPVAGGSSPTPTSSSQNDSPPSARPFIARAGDKAAQESAEFYRLLVESVQDYAIFALDTKGYILSWNAGAQRSKGYTADEAIGKHFSIFYPAQMVAEGFPEFELRTALNKGRFEDEGWRIRKDGTRFWANVVITALRDASGTAVGFAKVTRDLSERRDAEQALRESEEGFRFLVEGVKEYAIIRLDTTGRVVTWNEGAMRIKGYRPSEIIGRSYAQFYPAEDRAAHKPERQLEVAARDGRFEDEGWRVRQDGSQFWANVLLTARRDERGELIGFAKLTRDLTEQRAAQQRELANARRAAAEEAGRRAAEDRAREMREFAERLQQQATALEARSREAEEA